MHACVGCLLDPRTAQHDMHFDTAPIAPLMITCDACRVFLDVLLEHGRMQSDNWRVTSRQTQQTLVRLAEEYAKGSGLHRSHVPLSYVAHAVHLCGDQLPVGSVETGPGRCASCRCSWQRMSTPRDQLPPRCPMCGTPV